MSKNLAIKALDFDQIKTDLKNFLKEQVEFSDYNFEGSGMTVLLDTLAYNSHRIGFYTHMLANEAFINSATLNSSMNSHAKGMNYIPKSKSASKATVNISYVNGSIQQPHFYIPRGTEIISDNNSQDTRKFIITDDVYITNSGDNITPLYISNDIVISEGSFDELYYTVDTTQANQRYVIQDEQIDINTLRVRVFENQGDVEYSTWKLASDLMEINKDSNVFFLSVNESNYYEIFFGNGVYGKKPNNNNFVELSYVKTSGVDGNGATKFKLTLPQNGWDSEVTTKIISEGGLGRETVDDMRFNIPYHYRRQNRLVTVDDYKNIILSDYRNVNAINVWGGETHTTPTYGTVFICIKPKFGNLLSNTGKDLIKSIIQKYNMPTISIQILDPEYLFINMEVETLYNPLLTTLNSGEITTLINTAIQTYDDEKLSKFNSLYSNSNLAADIKLTDPSILTTQTKLEFERRIHVIENSNNAIEVNFLNEITESTVKSNYFMFRLNQSQLYDSSGVLKIRYLDTTTDTWKVYTEELFGKVDSKTGTVNISGVEFNGFYGNDESLILTAIPVDQDFRTDTNNILAINKVNINAIKDYQG